MVEFSINLSIVASMGYVPFELTYGYMPKMIKTIEKTEYAGVQDFANKARDVVLNAHDALCTYVVVGAEKVFPLIYSLL